MNFQVYWQGTYSNCPMISSQLRHVFPQRWVRFHSLPESKRYAENENEYNTILQRHNAVLDYLAKSGESLWLISTELGDTLLASAHSDKKWIDRNFLSPHFQSDSSERLPYVDAVPGRGRRERGPENKMSHR